VKPFVNEWFVEHLEILPPREEATPNHVVIDMVAALTHALCDSDDGGFWRGQGQEE
jgi:hypothetical protein